MPSASAIAQKIIDVLPEAVGTIFDQHDRYESIEQRNAKGNVVIVNLPIKNGMKASAVIQSNIPALLPSVLRSFRSTIRRYMHFHPQITD